MEKATAWGPSFTPTSLFSEVVALFRPRRKRERGRTPAAPQEWPCRGPRRPSHLPRQREASGPSQLPGCRLLRGWVQSSEGFCPQPAATHLPASLSGKGPASLLSTPPAPPWDSAGDPATQVRAARALPESPRRPPDPEARLPSQGPRARRPPPPLPAGGGSAGAATPRLGSWGAPRGCAVRGSPAPGAAARSGRARCAQPGRRGRRGGRSPASAATLAPPRAPVGHGLRSGSRGRRSARRRSARLSRLPPRPPGGPSGAAASFPRSRALRPRLSLLSQLLRSSPSGSPASRLAPNLRMGLTLQTFPSGLCKKRGSRRGRGWPGRGSPAQWPRAATWRGHPPWAVRSEQRPTRGLWQLSPEEMSDPF